MTLAAPTAGLVSRATAIRGELRLPSDKSVAHRALIANGIALAEGTDRAEERVVVTVRAPGDDLRSTMRCLRDLGLAIGDVDVGGTSADRLTEITLTGPALDGSLAAPRERLDCGNSGTTMRLLAGLLAGQPLGATLDGDRSLRRRPMERLAQLLRAMGATLVTTDGRAPIHITGSSELLALDHRLPVASAQLLGALCLAALSAGGETRVLVPGPTRDHTERLLAWMGVPIERHETHGADGSDGSGTQAAKATQAAGATVTTIRGPARPRPRSLTVAGDPSAATAWLVAGAVHPDAELRLVGVGLNPTRLEAVEVLREMGADIAVLPATRHPSNRAVAGAAGDDPGSGGEETGPEPVGDLVARSSGRLRAARLSGPRVAALIDELPALAVAMAAADGTSELRDAAELRVKESDRIATVVAGLAAIGARVEELPDGWRVRAGAPRDARVATGGDHRIAIAFATAALAGVAGSVRLDDPACVGVSYPTFWEHLAQVTPGAEASQAPPATSAAPT